MPALGAIFTGRGEVEIPLFLYKYYCTQQKSSYDFSKSKNLHI